MSETIIGREILMHKKQVIEFYCLLGRSVTESVFKFDKAADCICPSHRSHPLAHFEYSPDVLKFIMDAVSEKIQRERNERGTSTEGEDVRVECDSAEHARLIAAAPDLLAACLARIDEWHADNRNFTRKEPKSLSMMRAAVLKAAEGK